MNRAAWIAGFIVAACVAAPRLFADPTSSELLTRTLALVPNEARGERVYRTQCASCHGFRAQGDGAKALPALAGQREPYLLYQLVQIATLDRAAPEMHAALRRPQSRDPQAWRDVAAFIARRPRDAAVQTGTGAALTHGKALYEKTCVPCHGKRAEGSDSEAIPRLNAQHYSYLLAQLRQFAQGHRTRLDPPAVDFTAGLASRDQEAVADFLSRLPP